MKERERGEREGGGGGGGRVEGFKGNSRVEMIHV